MAVKADNKKFIYVMYNPNNQITVECSKDYVVKWIARGFIVKEIKTIQPE